MNSRGLKFIRIKKREGSEFSNDRHGLSTRVAPSAGVLLPLRAEAAAPMFSLTQSVQLSNSWQTLESSFAAVSNILILPSFENFKYNFFSEFVRDSE